MLGNSSVKRHRHSALSPGEMMTIVVLFHVSGYRIFKDFYLKYVCPHLKAAFSKLASYSQMVRLKQSVLMPLCAYLTHKKGSATILASDALSVSTVAFALGEESKYPR